MVEDFNELNSDELIACIPCPACSKERMMVFAREKVKAKVSVRCHKCGRLIVFNLDEMSAKLTKPLKGGVNKFK